MTLASRSLWTPPCCWADRLGVPPSALEELAVTVGQAIEGGIQPFSCEDPPIIGVPQTLLDPITERREGVASLDPVDEVMVNDWFTGIDAVEQVVCPTFYGSVPLEGEWDRQIIDKLSQHEFVRYDDGVYRYAIPAEDVDRGGIWSFVISFGIIRALFVKFGFRRRRPG